ncbi:MAG: hypothetical protein GY841_02810 [FCB group bacterium]|nr:hypothetical protein [FCB group bacterium]
MPISFLNVTTPPPGRKTGCLNQGTGYDDKGRRRVGGILPVFEDVFKPAAETWIPRSEWGDHIGEHVGLEQFAGPVKSQNGYNSCASNSSTTCQEITWNKAFGMKKAIQLSPNSVYEQIVSRDNGSNMYDNINQLKEVGALPTPTKENKANPNLKHFMEANAWRDGFPKDWQETAGFLRADEWFDVQSFDGLAVALLRGFVVSYARSMHAIVGMKLVYENRKWYVKYLNSWGDWGDNGYGHDSESFCSSGIRSFGAWAQRTVITPTWMEPPKPIF